MRQKLEGIQNRGVRQDLIILNLGLLHKLKKKIRKSYKK
jgi:hypothetical protein